MNESCPSLRIVRNQTHTSGSRNSDSPSRGERVAISEEGKEEPSERLVFSRQKSEQSFARNSMYMHDNIMIYSSKEQNTEQKIISVESIDNVWSYNELLR